MGFESQWADWQPGATDTDLAADEYACRQENTYETYRPVVPVGGQSGFGSGFASGLNATAGARRTLDRDGYELCLRARGWVEEPTS